MAPFGNNNFVAYNKCCLPPNTPFFSELLPDCTCTIHIHTNMLYSVIMNMLSYAVMKEHNGEIIKGLGGLMILVLLGLWLKRKDKKACDNSNSMNQLKNIIT